MSKTQRDIAELAASAQGHHRRSGSPARQPEGDAADCRAYKRYLEKFDAQETQIEKYQADIKKCRAPSISKRRFRDFLDNFSAD